jgi:uncharacterized coiled-coil protein SlyX
MAETNGSGKNEDHEDRIAKLEAARKEMEDTMVVMAHLESKAGARIKEHAEFIARHEQAMSEIDEKLNALITIVGKMQGGIESRPS